MNDEHFSDGSSDDTATLRSDDGSSDVTDSSSSSGSTGITERVSVRVDGNGEVLIPILQLIKVLRRNRGRAIAEVILQVETADDESSDDESDED